MNAKRLILVLAPFACVLCIALFVRTAPHDIPRSTARGQRLSIATLGVDERVVVSKLFAHRGDPIIREYRIGSAADPRRVEVLALSWAEEAGKVITKTEKVLAVRSLTTAEAEGLDEMVSYFRLRKEEGSSAARHYRLTYFRAGKEVGEEFFIGFSLPDHLVYLAREGERAIQNPDYDYSRIAEQAGTTPEHVARVLPFEWLEQEPNQQPTR